MEYALSLLLIHILHNTVRRRARNINKSIGNESEIKTKMFATWNYALSYLLIFFAIRSTYSTDDVNNHQYARQLSNFAIPLAN